MISDFATYTRRLETTSSPAGRPRHGDAGQRDTRPPFSRDVWLRPGNLLDVCDALGAQQFSLVDDEVTFTARSTDRVRRWRGHLEARGVVEL